MSPFRVSPEFMEIRRLEAIALADSTSLISVKKKHLSAALAWQLLADTLSVEIEKHDLAVVPLSTKQELPLA